jgi:hypothetical protein
VVTVKWNIGLFRQPSFWTHPPQRFGVGRRERGLEGWAEGLGAGREGRERRDKVEKGKKERRERMERRERRERKGRKGEEGGRNEHTRTGPLGRQHRRVNFFVELAPRKIKCPGGGGGKHKFSRVPRIKSTRYHYVTAFGEENFL